VWETGDRTFSVSKKSNTGQHAGPAADTPQQKPSKITGSAGDFRVAEASFAAGAAKKEQVPETSAFEDAPEVAFAGRSNVGKSSLLNMLLSRKSLARTSNTPGCTRQINFFDVRLAETGTPPVRRRLVFVDLPGYGYAKVSKTETASWKALLEGYLRERPTDVRRGLEEEERALADFLEQRPSLPVFVAATKLDKLTKNARKPAVVALTKTVPEGVVIIATSAETGEGRDALWKQIVQACDPSDPTG
jgi:GTP-binding protein